jgi:CRISPR/Cas system-associated exonuclease Cas4 (RecB family)
MVDAIPSASLPDIPSLVREARVRRREQWPVRSNRASLLGHPCLRHLVYWRTAWDQAALPDPDLMALFEEGRLHEDAVLQAIRDAGLTVVEQQRPFEYREHQITGHIDCKVVWNGTAIPVEVKSTSPHTWESIGAFDDLRTHKFGYVRQWAAQMQLYLLLSNAETGLMLLKNKVSGQLKQIVVTLDYAVAEDLVRKADAVNAHIASGTLPDRIPYDEEVCGRCTFFHLCLPDEALRGGATIVDDPDLEAQLRRRADLEPLAREYDRLDRAIKDRAKQALGTGEEAIVGTDWLIRIKSVTRRAYQVAEATVQVVQIQRLGPAPREDTP